ncbi:anaerobic ribonucleoside triphosphate reductase [Selenomonas sputigena]|uniref:Anaerobic ribonucleoside-triphosphate reductase n=1 Tax=Selenomonas sputigena (strain ATCC 35185 / DSM 20758 / CCUG 44933 / VPI D19B-28) TaxID=546271 RepID=C9LWU0_SELS3|nr:anaerobic ribonucleoside triphosphate reductase [Selenomonas sputigena]AEC01087.1 anaerobic ribonucleoside-triphosphate reductase [Selenomonas sputigena ATCC 35185]EEX76616.1 anaerobic ribonucleoside-triphosphate reductase [Selenomonas sputigena ATCC 35185]
MIKNIQKRTGQIVPFDAEKITDAIRKANLESIDETFSQHQLEKLTKSVIHRIEGEETPAVEFIQDAVEKALIKNNFASTAKAYILYRAEHAKIRDAEGDLMDIYNELTFKRAKDADIKRENANIDADTAMGTMLKYGSEGSKYFIDHHILPKDIAAAHIDGDIHIHDKDFYMLTETCCQIDLLKLFKDGFSTGHGYLREPNDIRSYAALGCIAIQANQNEMHGGQAIPNFDYSMAPGVRKTFRKLYFKELANFFAITLGMKQDDAKLLAKEIRRSLLPLGITIGGADVYKAALVDFLPAHQKAQGFEEISEKLAARAHDYAYGAALDATDNATFQAMEALIHNLNTMNSRAGAQVPFSSINYGTDTSPEGRMVMKNLLLATQEGLGNGETPIFPVQIFKVKEGVNYNEGEPNYDLFRLAMETSAKRLFPNFSFLDAPFNLQYYKPGDYNTEVAYMGCRTRVMGNVHDPEREVTCGRGNLSFTSINLPRLALLAKGDLDVFYSELDSLTELVIRQLLHRFKIQCAKKGRNYPFLMGQRVWIDSEKIGPDDEIAEVLKHGTLSMGFIGLAECLKALIGKHQGESEEAQALGLAIVGHMRRRMDEEAKRTGLNFTLLATPAEGLSGRFVRLDRKKFGEIEGVTDRDYYTNSFHVPVYCPIEAAKKIRLEAPYHALTNAGHISYIEMDGDPSKNLQAFEAIVRYMHDAGIGYGSVNHPVDRDPVCGYNGIIDNICPRCGRKENGRPFERIRRITGYLVGTIDRWNNAKRAEEHDRVKHGIG